MSRHMIPCGLLLAALFLSVVLRADDADFVYEANDDGSITITGYNGSDEELIIPQTIDGKNVSSIGAGAFAGHTNLTSVTIQSGVTNIGAEAFSGCGNLTNVSLPGDGITHLNDFVFAGCGFSSVTLPESVISIGARVFSQCYDLENMELPDNVASIGAGAFAQCWRLESVTMPDGVTNIGAEAFYECWNLMSVSIPSGVTSLNDNVFAESGLADITIPNNVTHIGDGVFFKCQSLRNAAIPDSVSSIGAMAFAWCTGLTNVTISKNVTSIGAEVFSRCSTLATISVDPDNQHYSDLNGVLFDKPQTTLICYPCSKTGDYAIPDSVSSIGAAAFFWCTGLTNVTIPDNVTSIGNRAFEHCPLSSLTLPDSVTDIGERAFAYGHFCSVVIPDGITDIAAGLFYECHSLTNAILAKNVASIAEDAFSWCTNLSGLYFMGDAPDAGRDAFYQTKPFIVYYQAGTMGWGETFLGYPTAEWTPATVATPTFAPDGGTHASGSLPVVIDCATAGALIRYTIDGEEPSTSSAKTIPGGTVTVPVPGTLKAKAFKAGMNPGAVKSTDYTIATVATPTFTPDGGQQVGDNVRVIIHCTTEAAAIYYTTNSAEPTKESAQTVSGGTVTVPVPGTLKARAFRAGMNPSAVKSANYSAAPTVATPVFNPDGGQQVGDKVKVKITCATAGATIRYTTDGKTPTEKSAKVTSGSMVSVPVPGTLKAKAFKAGMNPSAVKSASYTRGAPEPQASPLTAADFDGDRLADPALRNDKGWYVWMSGMNYQRSGPHLAGKESGQTIAADFDGDGRAAPALFNAKTGWLINFSASGYGQGGPYLPFATGGTGLAGDVDGDGLADPAVYNAKHGWFIWFSAQGYAQGGPFLVGVSNVTPVLADFDGDGLADPALYREADGWSIWFSTQGYTLGGPFLQGMAGYSALAADFDGDSLADPALYQLTTGRLYVWLSRAGYAVSGPHGPFVAP